jgi:hypothetical protein
MSQKIENPVLVIVKESKATILTMKDSKLAKQAEMHPDKGLSSQPFIAPYKPASTIQTGRLSPEDLTAMADYLGYSIDKELEDLIEKIWTTDNNPNDIVLTANKVNKIFLDCMLKEDEGAEAEKFIDVIKEENNFYRDGVSKIITTKDFNFIMVYGIVNTVAFHMDRLYQHREEVIELVKQLPEDYFIHSEGAGGSFVNLCMDRNDRQWAEHRNIEELVLLALALDIATYLMPRKLWVALPGGMPYIQFDTTGYGNTNKLRHGESYYVYLFATVKNKPYIVIDDVKHNVFFNDVKLGLDLDGDTIKVLVDAQGVKYATTIHGSMERIWVGDAILTDS